MSKTALLKTFSVGGAMLIAAFAFGGLLKSFIETPTLGFFVWMLAAAVVFLSLFLLQAILSDRFWLNAGLFAIAVVGFSVFLSVRASWILWLGAVVALILLIQAYDNGRKEIKNNLTIRLWRISRSVMVLSTTAIALFASLAYASIFDLHDTQQTKKALEVFIRPIEPIVGGYLPGFSANKSLTQIASGLLPAELKLADPETKNLAISNAASGLAAYFKNIAGVAVTTKDTIIDIFYKATIGRILTYSPLVQNAVLVAVALIFFLFIKFALLFVDWLATALTFALYELLLKFGFFKKELRTAEKQTIILE